MAGDPFLANYTEEDLRTASEFLSTWIPFLSADLCPTCTRTLIHRIRSLHSEVGGYPNSSLSNEPGFTVRTSDNIAWNENYENHKNCVINSFGSGKGGVDVNDTVDTNSLGSWKEAADVNDTADTNSFGSGKDGTNNWLEPISGDSTNGTARSTEAIGKISWADMTQEDQQLEGDEESEVSGNSWDGHARPGEDSVVVNNRKKTILSRDHREFIRFNNVKRKKDFIYLERFKGKLVNILEGLELHTGVFSFVEQKRIVDFVYTLHEMGKKGQLKARTFTAPAKWMKGKGRVTLQFGCCYNYAYDKQGNPPGILKNELVDPIPHLFKVMIRRLVAWHVLPPSCVPDSCIVNIYEEGDCIPPHIDNHDFVRPFCTVSFLSECNILFGSNLSILGPGEFSGPMAIPLPVGSVLVLNGNGADVAKHCVPAVPTRRISITFRRMDESKRPHDFVPEPDLQGLQPLSYETKESHVAAPERPNIPESDSSQMPITPSTSRYDQGILPSPGYGRGNFRDRPNGSFGRGSYSGPRSSLQVRSGSYNRRNVRVNLID